MVVLSFSSLSLSSLPKIFLHVDLCLRRCASATSNDNKSDDLFSMASHCSELDQLRDYKGTRLLLFGWSFKQKLAKPFNNLCSCSYPLGSIS